MGQDSLASWLRSVAEAKKYQLVFRATLANASRKFFLPKHRPIPGPNKQHTSRKLTSFFEKEGTTSTDEQPGDSPELLPDTSPPMDTYEYNPG